MSFLLLLLTSYHIIETIQIHYFTVTKVRSLNWVKRAPFLLQFWGRLCYLAFPASKRGPLLAHGLTSPTSASPPTILPHAPWTLVITLGSSR